MRPALVCCITRVYHLMQVRDMHTPSSAYKRDDLHSPVHLQIESQRQLGLVQETLGADAGSSGRVDLRGYGVGNKALSTMTARMSDNPATVLLNDNRISREGALILFEALTVTRLEVLDLANNAISGEGSMLLAEKIGQCHTLRELDIGGNSLGDLHVATVVQALHPCTRLQQLVVRGTGAASASAAAIAQLVQVSRPPGSPALEALDVAWNLLVGEAAVKLVDGLRANKSLQVRCSNRVLRSYFFLLTLA